MMWDSLLMKFHAFGEVIERERQSYSDAFSRPPAADSQQNSALIYLITFYLKLFPWPCFFLASSSSLWPVAVLGSYSMNLTPFSVISLLPAGALSSERGIA